MTDNTLDNITRKWWFYLIILILFFVPSYTAKPYEQSNILGLMKAVFSNPLILSVPILKPIAKIIPIILVAGIITIGNKMKQSFNIYFTLLNFCLAVFQHTAITGQYGLVVISGNITVILIVALFWIREIIIKRNDFKVQKLSLWKWWVVPFAIFAFWYPVDMKTITPHFNALYFINNESGLTYCMITPVILALLTMYYPNINIPTLRVTSYVGAVFGILNMISWFIMESQFWWMGVLHVPLLVISLYAFVLSNVKYAKSESI
ncbi:MAG: hypothetical protein JSV25_01395 [Spirochaetota bacterium]|nr:MAG: hypothetical protein JSV25_01395 [Spirochaetota bacterium]